MKIISIHTNFDKTLTFPIVATALVLYRCYIPGQSVFNYAGIGLWMVVISRWIFLFIRNKKNVHRVHFTHGQRIFLNLVLIAASVLACTNLPILWACQVSNSKLDEFIRNTQGKVASVCDPVDGVAPWKLPKLNVGLYPIFAYATDFQGGTYLVTTIRQDGLGPDVVSSGLAYRPALDESPYGKKYYKPEHLVGNWFTFEASNDY